MSESGLFELAKKCITLENTGFSNYGWKSKIVYEECRDRGISAFDEAVDAAVRTIDAIENVDLGGGVEEVSKPYIADINDVKKIDSDDIELPEKFDANKIFEILGLEPEKILICRALGDSMVRTGINNGDMLTVDTGETAKDGDIILAEVFGRQFIKRYRKIDENEWLISENPDYIPVKITDKMELRIIGVVKHILSKKL